MRPTGLASWAARSAAVAGSLLRRPASRSAGASDATPNRGRPEIVAYLLEAAGHVHQDAPLVHVTGTKGKGSVCALCAGALQRQGYRTGLRSGPQLHSWREGMRVDGEPISNDAARVLVERLEEPFRRTLARPDVERIIPFEVLVAMGFMHFRDAGTEANVVEVGMGGRGDATNVVTPAVSVVTPVGLDHTRSLGATVEEIAAEKAGIVKPSRPVVVGPQLPEVLGVLRADAAAKGSKLVEVGRDVCFEAGELHWPAGSRAALGQDVTVFGRLDTYSIRLRLLGHVQLENAATAVAALELLHEQGHPVSRRAIEEGFAGVEWPCRLEVLDPGRDGPLVVADGAHNPLSAARLRESLRRYFDYDRVVVLTNVQAYKNVAGVVGELARLAPEVVVTASRSERASDPALLADVWRAHGVDARPVEDPAEALETARSLAGPRGLVLATGSLSVAARARELVLGIEPELDLAF